MPLLTKEGLGGVYKFISRKGERISNLCPSVVSKVFVSLPDFRGRLLVQDPVLVYR